MSSGMNLEQAKEYAKTMTYSQAISNIKHSKGIEYRKATMIKLRELAEIADRYDRKTENGSKKPNNCEPQTDDDKKHCVFCKWVYEPNVCGRCRDMNLFADAIEDEPQTCDTCKYGEDKHRYAHICNECGVGINNYEPKDEPQTEYRKWETKPNADRPTVNTTCVGVAMALVEDDEDEPQTERNGR